MRMRFHYEADTRLYRVRGSHRDEQRIKTVLGFDPQIHSGTVRGGFCLYVTETERQIIEDIGIRISKKSVS